MDREKDLAQRERTEHPSLVEAYPKILLSNLMCFLKISFFKKNNYKNSFDFQLLPNLMCLDYINDN